MCLTFARYWKKDLFASTNSWGEYQVPQMLTCLLLTLSSLFVQVAHRWFLDFSAEFSSCLETT